MLGLFYPYGFLLMAVALLHFARRRPDTFWLVVILMGGAVGALVYILVEVIPDAGLLRGAFQVFPRRKRIKELEQEVRELRRANSILKSASAFFAAELDRPQK